MRPAPESSRSREATFRHRISRSRFSATHSPHAHEPPRRTRRGPRATLLSTSGMRWNFSGAGWRIANVEPSLVRMLTRQRAAPNGRPTSLQKKDAARPDVAAPVARMNGEQYPDLGIKRSTAVQSGLVALKQPCGSESDQSPAALLPEHRAVRHTLS